MVCSGPKWTHGPERSDDEDGAEMGQVGLWVLGRTVPKPTLPRDGEWEQDGNNSAEWWGGQRHVRSGLLEMDESDEW